MAYCHFFIYLGGQKTAQSSYSKRYKIRLGLPVLSLPLESNTQIAVLRKIQDRGKVLLMA
jgi:hypothetical protein